MALNPGPFSRPASSGVSGLVNTIAQSFLGAKTFLGALVASAGLTVQGAVAQSIGSSLGTVSGERGVVAGFTTSDGSVHSGAKPFSVGVGIGGTFVEKFYVTKSGAIAINGNANCTLSDGGNTIAATVVITTSTYFSSTSASTAFYAAAGGGFSANNLLRLWSESQGDAAGETAVRSGAFLAGHADAVMHAFGHTQSSTPVDVAKVMGSGRFDQKGVDDSANAGNRTQNNPVGINKLANGATTCVITNSLCSATSRVMITFHDDPGSRYWVTRAAGSFTVTLSAAAGADKVFSWEVSNLF